MKSIFDGWTKKVEGTTCDGEGGQCARGFLHGIIRRNGGVQSVLECEVRIGKWIQANMNPPESGSPWDDPQHDPICALIWANNTKALDIEGFKLVDLLTQGYVPEDAHAPEEVHAESREVRA